jgi:hypothetical protein
LHRPYRLGRSLLLLGGHVRDGLTMAADAVALDWRATLRTEPGPATCLVTGAELSPSSLVIWIDLVLGMMIDYADEADVPSHPKRPGEPRFWIRLANGTEFETVGEWDGIDPDRLATLHVPGWEALDFSHPLGGRASVSLRPPPPPGPLTFVVEWLDRGLSRSSVTFLLEQAANRTGSSGAL